MLCPVLVSITNDPDTKKMASEKMARCLSYLSDFHRNSMFHCNPMYAYMVVYDSTRFGIFVPNQFQHMAKDYAVCGAPPRAARSLCRKFEIDYRDKTWATHCHICKDDYKAESHRPVINDDYGGITNKGNIE